jgi:hypothetical protein
MDRERVRLVATRLLVLRVGAPVVDERALVRHDLLRNPDPRDGGKE